MRHILIAHNNRDGDSHINRMSPFFFEVQFVQNNNKRYVRLHSGRVDEIKIISHEKQLLGHRFNGEILRTSNSSEIEDLYRWSQQYSRYASKNIKPDPQTIFWHWATRDDYMRYRGSENLMDMEILNGLKEETRTRR